MKTNNIKLIINYFFNYGLNPIILIFTTPMISSLVFPIEYGDYNYYQTIIGLLAVFLFSWIPVLITKYLNRNFRNYDENKAIFILISKKVIAIYIFISIIIMALKKDLFFLLLLLNQLFIFLSDLVLTYYQTNGEIKKYSIANITKNIFHFIIIAIFYFYKIRTVYILFISNMIFNIFFIKYVAKKNKNIFKIKRNKTLENEMVKFALPLIGINLAALILNLGDRIMMKYMIDNPDYYIGVYSMNYNIYSKIITIITSSFLAIIPSTLYLKYEKEGIKEYINELKKMIELYLIAVFVINILIYINYNSLNFLLLNKDYLLDNNLPMIILNGYIYYGLYLLQSNYLTVIKQLKYINYFIIFSSILNIALNFLFLKKFGFIFCAISTLICFFINFLLLEIFYRVKLKIKILNFKMLVLSCINLVIIYISHIKPIPIIFENKIHTVLYFCFQGLMVGLLFLVLYLIRLKKLMPSRFETIL